MRKGEKNAEKVLGTSFSLYPRGEGTRGGGGPPREIHRAPLAHGSGGSFDGRHRCACCCGVCGPHNITQWRIALGSCCGVNPHATARSTCPEIVGAFRDAPFPGCFNSFGIIFPASRRIHLMPKKT